MYQAKQFASINGLPGMSERMMQEHYKLYEGYVKKANELEEKLKTVDRSTANQVYSDLRSLKVELAFAIGGIKNHEIFFDHLGGAGGAPQGVMGKLIERNFGSFEIWADDLKATGLAAR